MALPDDFLRLLQETSRTFFLPIRQLSPGLQEAIASAYLCMRAIDEIEDHLHLADEEKVNLLLQVSQQLQAQTSVASFSSDAFLQCFTPCQAALPEVTRRLADWACLPPDVIAPRIWEATAAMAQRMATWVECGWRVQTEDNLKSLHLWSGRGHGSSLMRSVGLGRRGATESFRCHPVWSRLTDSQYPAQPRGRPGARRGFFPGRMDARTDVSVCLETPGPD